MRHHQKSHSGLDAALENIKLKNTRKIADAPDLISGENEPFSEDVFGSASAVFIRDVALYDEDPPHKQGRQARMCTTFVLLFLCIGLQTFLLYKVKQFVTAKAVHDIRFAYDEYESHMYDFTVELESTGFRRGQGTLNIAEGIEKFKSLNNQTAEIVCRIPLSQPSFFFSILFIWTLLVAREFNAMKRWWRCLIFNTTLRRLIIVPRRLTYRPPPLLDPLNCLETRSRSFRTLSPRLFWAAAEGRRPEESG